MENRECIHCGKCTKHCLFLQKYGIDIGQMNENKELAYHCFLCGKCTEVCPVGIDGRERILHIRREQVEKNGGKVPEKGYGMLLWEKQDYKFANYRNQTGESVLFPGCNFPSFYPETTRYVAKLLKEKAGIGVVFDCCGKPVAELGLKEKEEEIVSRLQERFAAAGIEEVVTLCPNCYHFLKPRLNVTVVSIYQKLHELGLGRQIEGKRTMYPPCPDRAKGELLQHIRLFLTEEPEILTGVQCCGLGGCAGGKEPELAAKMGQETAAYAEAHGKSITTYCASCTGNFLRKGCAHTEHVLSLILGKAEKPDIKKSVYHRMKTKYWRES